MQPDREALDTKDFSFQMDLLQMNLHLTDAEQAPQRQIHAHEVALEQMRTLAPRA